MVYINNICFYNNNIMPTIKKKNILFTDNLELFIYEHCPYCIRVRMLADIKKLNLKLNYLANDDINSHLKHINKKQVPFLKTSTNYIVESIKICTYLDSLTKHPIKSKTLTPLYSLVNELKEISKHIVYPKFLDHKLNYRDFPNIGAKNYFINKKKSYIDFFYTNIKDYYTSNQQIFDNTLFALLLAHPFFDDLYNF